MTIHLKFALALTSALALAGCATPADSTTYSGSAKAAVFKKTQAANAYIRSAFSTPMPGWDVNLTKEAPARQRAVENPTPPPASDTVDSSVKSYPVSAPDSPTPASR